MRSRILLSALGLILVVVAGLFFWARAILASDRVRTTLESQLTQAIGQPVAIGGIEASIFPLAVDLADVRIGQPPRIQARTLHIGANLRALLSRRIEQASVRLDGARIELPLPEFALGGQTQPAEPSEPALTIVSVDEIVLSDMEVMSGGRTLRGNLEARLEGNGLTLSKLTLGAGEANIEASGSITDLAGPVGELQVKAGALNLDDLIAFASDFSTGIGGSAAAPPSGTGASSRGAAATAAASQGAMNLSLALEAERATLGELAIDKLSGRAVITPGTVALNPVSFGVFGGRYDGSLSATLGDNAPTFRWIALLSGIDVAAATAFAGSPDTVTGRLAGRIDLAGTGADASAAMKSARGTARLDLTDGVVRRLGLVRTVIVATSMRADEARGGGSSDEPFSRLGVTLAIANGGATTDDLLFESTNLRLAAAGRASLDGSLLNLTGKVQLSDALSAQAGRDLVRYTQEEGRVTLPATITGSAAAPSVRIDVADMAKRAIRNRANEEAQKAIKKGLGGLIRR